MWLEATVRRRRSGASTPERGVERHDRRARARTRPDEVSAVVTVQRPRHPRPLEHAHAARHEPVAQPEREPRGVHGGAGAHLDRAADHRRVAARLRLLAAQLDDLGAVDRPAPHAVLRRRRRHLPVRRRAIPGVDALRPRTRRRSRRTLASDCATASRRGGGAVALGQRRAVEGERGDEAAVAPARPVPAAPGLEHRHRRAGLGEVPGGPHARVAAAEHDDVGARVPGERREPRRRARLRDPPAVGVVVHRAQTLPSDPMRAVVITGKGPPEVLQVQDRPDPQARSRPGRDRRPRRGRELRRPDGAGRHVPGRAAAAGRRRLRGRRRGRPGAARACTASRSATA